MRSNRKVKCFCILPFLCFILGGCGAKEALEQLQEATDRKAVDAAKEKEYVSISDLERLAENNAWREKAASSVCFETDWHDTYAYNTLTETERIWYEDINLLLSTHYEGSIQLAREGIEAGLTEETLDKIYQCVLTDHPEYFYVTGYEYTKYTSMGKLLGIEVTGSYNVDLQESILRKEQIETAADKLLEQAPVDASDYDKIKYVYETIIYHTEYDLKAPDNQNIYSVFVGKASVCQGYAKATQYLLGKLGVDCTLVQGMVGSGEGHSWNMVKSDEEYYYVDTTWGDASYTAMEELPEAEVSLEINYDYLCVTTGQLFQTHMPEQDIALPDCTATKDNYYIREGCYFYAYDEEQLKREFAEAETQKGITLKCDSEGVYHELYTELIENQRVFEYLPENQARIAFVQDEQQLSMTFWVTK